MTAPNGRGMHVTALMCASPGTFRGNEISKRIAESWTAAEELALADHTRKMGLGAWDELSDLVRPASTNQRMVVVVVFSRSIQALF